MNIFLSKIQWFYFKNLTFFLVNKNIFNSKISVITIRKFSNLQMSTLDNQEEEILKLKKLIQETQSIVIGAGSGLSTSAGFEYGGKRFRHYFSDFREKYHIRDMYSGSFYNFDTPEERWAFMSRVIYVNRYKDIPNSLYSDLYDLIKSKDYFVLTSNVDHCFQKSGFDKKRLFYSQGDYGLFQCSVPCIQKTWDNEETITKMYKEQENMKIPSYLIPTCPNCGKPMTTNLRGDRKFVQDDGWKEASERYKSLFHIK